MRNAATVERSATRLACIAASVGIALATSSPTSACGFHGAMGDNFSLAHPRSMEVAFATLDAVGDGIIAAPIAPDEAGRQGYWRAQDRIRRFESRLPVSTSLAQGGGISILLVDSLLWSRFAVVDGRYALQPHTDGPPSGDAVIVTSEPAVAAILEGGLTVADAFARKLLVVDGLPYLAKRIANSMSEVTSSERSAPRKATFLPAR
jgi:hypothetical protein